MIFIKSLRKKVRNLRIKEREGRLKTGRGHWREYDLGPKIVVPGSWDEMVMVKNLGLCLNSTD